MGSVEKNGTIYEFGSFQLIPGEDLLLRHGESVSLNHKAFRVLGLLVERNGHLVSKSEIMETVWQDAFVEEGSLTKSIWTIRNALGDVSKERFIQTIPKRGYRFVFPVSVLTDRPAAFRRVDRRECEDQARPLKDAVVKSENNANGLGNIEGEALNQLNGHPSVPQRAEKQGFRNVLAAAGVAGILLVTAFVGYYGTARKISAIAPRSIAVLPVAPVVPADRKDLYALGIAESLINQLSSADGVVVRPLSSVREYAETTKDPVAVGLEQKSDYVLASNYQITDGKIKITAQLYNVRSGAVEYTLQTQKSTADLFAAQDAIAADFGGRLMKRLGVSSLRPVKPRGTDNEQAYLAYINGMALLDRENPGPRLALEYLERASNLDPNYARAWAGKALAHAYAKDFSDPKVDNYRLFNEAIDRAFAIDPNLSDGFTALCHNKLYAEWDYDGAEKACRQAIDLDPTSAFARQEYSIFLRSRGRFDQGLTQLKAAMDLDPTSFRTQAIYGNHLYYSRRYEEAVVQFKMLVDLKPDRDATYQHLIRALEMLGREDEAFEWFIVSLTASKRMKIDAKIIQRFRNAFLTSGYRGVLLERCNPALEKVLLPGAGCNAACLVRLGEMDKAFEQLEQAYRSHSYSLAAFVPVEPQYDPLRSDPRWADLVRRVRGE